MLVACQDNNAYYEEDDVHDELWDEISQSSEKFLLESEISRVEEFDEEWKYKPIEGENCPEVYVPPGFKEWIYLIIGLILYKESNSDIFHHFIRIW